MDIDLVQLIINYVDAAIEYALVSQEVGEDGCTFSYIDERRALEAAKARLLASAAPYEVIEEGKR